MQNLPKNVEDLGKIIAAKGQSLINRPIWSHCLFALSHYFRAIVHCLLNFTTSLHLKVFLLYHNAAILATAKLTLKIFSLVFNVLSTKFNFLLLFKISYCNLIFVNKRTTQRSAEHGQWLWLSW